MDNADFEVDLVSGLLRRLRDSIIADCEFAVRAELRWLAAALMIVHRGDMLAFVSLCG